MNSSKLIHKIINIVTFIFLAIILISSIASIIFLDNKIDLRFVYLLLFCTVMNILVIIDSKDLIKFKDYVLESSTAKILFLVFLFGIFMEMLAIYMYILEICNYEKGISSTVLTIVTFTMYNSYKKYLTKHNID